MIRIFFVGLIILSFTSFASLFAQGYRIDVSLPDAANQKAQLAYHFLEKVYIQDTIRLNSEGVGTWQGDSLLPQGLYKVYLDNDHHFDFLLGADQQFSIENKTFESKNAKIKGAVETEEFVRYLVFLQDLKSRGLELNKELKTADKQQKEQINKEREKLNNEMLDYRSKIVKKYPDFFLAKFMLADKLEQLDISSLPAEVQNNDSLLFKAQFQFQLKHYWDNFDYTDARFLYTPFYKTKIDTWFNKVLYPTYDSVKPYVYKFLEDVKSEKRIFQFATSYFLNASINSKIMGMDALFVDLARDFYLSGEAFWTSDESMEVIRENVLFMQDNLIGKTAPDLTLESFDGEYVNLHQIDAKLTILVIYEPNCSHCKVFVPELYNDVYLPNKDKGLEVYAIYSMDDKEEWGNFLTKENLFDWLNVWDEHHVSRFKILYDGRKTPGVYLLDENKKIIAKKLMISQLKALVEEKLN